MDKSRSRQRGRPWARLPLWAAISLTVLGVGLVVALLAFTGWQLFGFVRQMAAEAPIVAQPEFEAGSGDQLNPQAVDSAPVALTPASPSQDAPVTLEELPVWEGSERITILLLGIDRRCEEEGPVRTDSMIVLTIDPVGKTAGLLSLPRDLWVEIPDFGVDRINQAHYLGEGFELPGGGPALAVDTVESTLGIDIQHYATVNFAAFIEFVDLIGGIPLEVPEKIEDLNYPDECYGFDPFIIDTGPKILDGATALKYARTRATEGGDVDRARRQQQVILAARDQAIAQIPDLLLQAPQLWETFENNIRTTLTFDEALQLALLVRDIPAENIQQAVIGYNDVYVSQTPNGQNVLVPIRENIRAIRDELFTSPAAPAISLESISEQVQTENARVALLNGTTIFGLASATEAYLLEQDVNVVEIGNADSAAYQTSQLIDFGNHPYSVQYLVELLGIPPLNASQGQQPDGDYDILVILGDDWRVPEDTE
ncbi:MAG: LCP family protein [Ardenticatenaceae bacterium]|nr:LCP family protein [Ardenticatenaceae bacterium]